MKKVYITIGLLIIGLMTFAQPYYTYTANNNGLWTNNSNWTIAERTDGVAKNKIVIPSSYSIIANNGVNSLGLGTVEIYIFGTLDMASNTTLSFPAQSSIELNNGFIVGNAGNQQILIGGVIKYRGNLDGLKTGTSIAHNTTGVSPNGFTSLTTLPVNFTSFYISKSSQNIQMTWSTDKEINNSHFDIERSSNGVDWERIAVVFGSGTNSNSSQYSYNDKNISSVVVYYRLRQVDVDGRFVYSSIKSIRMDQAISAVKIYSSEKNVVIDLNSVIKNNLVVSVVNSNGQVISKQSFKNPSYKINLHLQNAPTGTYVVHVTDNAGMTEVKKIIL